MGILDFAKNAGEKIFQPGEARREDAIEKHLATYGIHALKVEVEGHTATLTGTVKDMATREKAVLIAGNIDGIDKVDDRIRVSQPAAPAAPAAARAPAPAVAPTTVVTPTSAAAANATANAAATTATPATDAGDQWSSRTYTVKSGDTLSKIAKEMYGEASKCTQIFEANQPMLKDPDRIYPGQVLRIPKEQ